MTRAIRTTRRLLISEAVQVRDLANAHDWTVAIVTAALILGLFLVAGAIG